MIYWYIAAVLFTMMVLLAIVLGRGRDNDV